MSIQFGIKIGYGSCHGKISARDQFMPKGQVSPKFPISAIWPSFDSHNQEVADHLESDNEPSENEIRVVFRNMGVSV
jgi:hypothetical protein